MPIGLGTQSNSTTLICSPSVQGEQFKIFNVMGLGQWRKESKQHFPNPITLYLLLKICQGKLTRKLNNFSKEVVRSSAELLTVDGKGTTQNHQHIDYTIGLN